MQFKKVSGERIAAAIIDSIIVGIVGAIPILIYFIVLIAEEGSFEAFIEEFILSSSGMTGAELSNGFQIVTMVSSLVVGVIYFAVIPYKWNGQTIAKKLLKIKAVNEFGDNPTFVQHLIRAIQVWGAYVGIIMLPLLAVDLMTYSIVSGLVQWIVQLALFVSLIMLLARTDGKGIHDLMAGTFVVKVDTDFNAPFIEKATQASEWADVEYDHQTNKDDGWKQPEQTSDDEWENNSDDKWKY